MTTRGHRWVVREGTVRGVGRYLAHGHSLWTDGGRSAAQFDDREGAAHWATRYGGHVVGSVRGPAVPAPAGLFTPTPHDHYLAERLSGKDKWEVYSDDGHILAHCFDAASRDTLLASLNASANGGECYIGVHCHEHGRAHGGEAEELRAGVEKLMAEFHTERDDDDDGRDATWCAALQKLLDDVDARDSLAFGEAKECPCEGEADDPGPHIASCKWSDPEYDGGRPFDAVTPPLTHGPWTTLAALRAGAVFETRDGMRSVRCVHERLSGIDCVSLETGRMHRQAGHTEVRELILGDVASEPAQPPADAMAAARELVRVVVGGYVVFGGADADETYVPLGSFSADDADAMRAIAATHLSRFAEAQGAHDKWCVKQLREECAYHESEASRWHVQWARATGALADAETVQTDPIEVGIRALTVERNSYRDKAAWIDGGATPAAPWTTLAALRPGAVFETREGQRAVKTLMWTDVHERHECVYLDTGVATHRRKDTEVRELAVGGARAEPSEAAPSAAVKAWRALTDDERKRALGYLGAYPEREAAIAVLTEAARSGEEPAE